MWYRLFERGWKSGCSFSSGKAEEWGLAVAGDRFVNPRSSRCFCAAIDSRTTAAKSSISIRGCSGLIIDRLTAEERFISCALVSMVCR